jgi:hypothetical protein
MTAGTHALRRSLTVADLNHNARVDADLLISITDP